MCKVVDLKELFPKVEIPKLTMEEVKLLLSQNATLAELPLIKQPVT